MRALALVAALALAGCAGGTASTPPSATIAAATSTLLAATPGPSPASTGPCLDRESFADSAEAVVAEMTGLSADLKAGDATKAKADAKTLATGLRELADLVSPVQPAAGQGFRAAADGIDSAVTQFPGGQTLVDKAQADMAAALSLVSTAYCS